MSSRRDRGIVFTGDGGIGVKQFLRRMESWFATMGDDWTGGTSKSKTMRVGQIHIACPIHSAAGKFIGTLDNDVYWDEELLRQALISQFHDAEREEHLDEDILSSMSTLRQGSQDVFKYSGKVLKLLQRQPSGSRHYDRILVGYYLDGLKSKRLRELAVLAFRKRDSHETPSQVVKEVMRLANELKVKGYRTHSGRNGDDDDDDDDNSVFSVFNSSSDSESDEDDYYGASRKKKSDKSKRSSGKRAMRLKNKERKQGKDCDDKATFGGEMSDLREMMQDLKRMHKATMTAGTGVVARLTEEDGSPLETYAVGRNARYLYERRNTAHPTSRRPGRYYQEHRGGYTSFYDYGHPESGQGPNFTRPSDMPSGIYRLPYTYERATEPESIIGPDGMLYYPSCPPLCNYCQEEGHLRPQCPKLCDLTPRMTELGPEHPDTPVAPRKVPPPRVHCEEVNAVEHVMKPSVLDRATIHEVTTVEVDSLARRECARKLENSDGDDDDEDFEWEEEEMMDDAVDECYPGQIAENPEN